MGTLTKGRGGWEACGACFFALVGTRVAFPTCFRVGAVAPESAVWALIATDQARGSIFSKIHAIIDSTN